MPIVFDSADALLAAVGRDLGVTEWMPVTQERVNLFADATDDHQWIHVDPVKAKDGPFGACVAHGYLTLSLAARFMPQLIEVRNMKMGVNYGCDKVRFPAPVRVGARIRGRGELVAVERARDGGLQSTLRLTVEIENEAKPACVVDTISRYYF
ncbi:MAG: MaoC family dehydratase [Sinimarinibacterium flocculans]|uniref:Acyl dehydratase n=1 Tax=Sinimarinibacterium flocculans TaxID=985250 RepID=A0A318EDF5_9GAMM|nr:MaoC family dehydratase [Sinimarinibacterium flocculans]MEC9363089.1 MaoC family dehydratase [Pseudomonadota bacterium]PXV70553.1 acyl dehydratase [Sinimarinibacterium flocculans]